MNMEFQQNDADFTATGELLTYVIFNTHQSGRCMLRVDGAGVFCGTRAACVIEANRIEANYKESSTE